MRFRVLAALILTLALPILPAHAASSGARLIIPAYFGPGAAWHQIDMAPAGSIVIINPDSGPGRKAMPGYRRVIAAARAAHLIPVAYVPTGYGRRPASQVVDDMDRYRRFYGLKDVFFDEAAARARVLARYTALSQDARAYGAKLVVINPGVVPARGYFSLGDIVVTFEDDYQHYLNAGFPPWLRRISPNRKANIVIGASTVADAQNALALASARGAGYVFVTDQRLPNPYGALPSYFSTEL